MLLLGYGGFALTQDLIYTQTSEKTERKCNARLNGRICPQTVYQVRSFIASRASRIAAFSRIIASAVPPRSGCAVSTRWR